MRHSIGKIPQVGDAILRLGWNRRHFIAQAEIHCEIFFQPNVILYVGAEQSLAQSDIRHIKTGGSLEHFRPVGQIIDQRIEAKTPVYGRK